MHIVGPVEMVFIGSGMLVGCDRALDVFMIAKGPDMGKTGIVT